MVNFKGKPKTRKQQAQEFLNKHVIDSAFEKHADDKEAVLLLCNLLESKKIGDEVIAGERFLYNKKPYQAVSAHTLTSHHNPETEGTHLYTNVIYEDEETGHKEITIDSLPFHILKDEIIKFNGELWKWTYNEEQDVRDPSWLPPFWFWSKVE